jgi:hypothetical protein
MALDYRIDHDRRVVFAEGRGTLTDQDVFGYQQAVWSRPEVATYDELVDMRGVEHIALPSVDRLRALADLSAQMDVPSSASKLAIIASESYAFGLGRMYQMYRDTNPRSAKQVSVFRSFEDAIIWLGISHSGQDSDQRG